LTSFDVMTFGSMIMTKVIFPIPEWTFLAFINIPNGGSLIMWTSNIFSRIEAYDSPNEVKDRDDKDPFREDEESLR
ncbi:hypothetical protein KI387_004189, partial [Taxus chinensis]